MNVIFNNPFSMQGEWRKGNLHCHSTRSDGKRSPSDAVRFYKEAGYHFTAITDHNRFISETDLAVDDSAFTLIRGQEIDVVYNEKNFHIVGLNLKEELVLSPETRAQCDPRIVIDAIKAQEGAAILAHPYCNGLTLSDMLLCEGIIAIEAYNHSSHVKRDVGRSFVHWDNLLMHGARMNALAVDDAHHYTGRTYLPDDALGGWIMLKTPSLTSDDIIESVTNGFFYSSMGPRIKELEIIDNTIYVKTSKAKAITFRAAEWAARKVNRMKGAKAITEAEYRITGESPFIRVQCEDFDGRMAFTNPIYIER